MSGASSIEWCDATWNPVRGCSRVSEGCRNCYAERNAIRFARPKASDSPVKSPAGGYAGFVENSKAGPRWTGKVELIPSALDWPLRKRKPLRIFVNSMSDLFHERLSATDILRVFLVMAQCPQHTFQILTKRPERMQRLVAEWLKPAMTLASGAALSAPVWPLPNVWLGVSVEDHATADERIPLLLQTPAAKRFVSYEPALGPVDFAPWMPSGDGFVYMGETVGPIHVDDGARGLDWIIVGGESGPGARPFDIAWARDAVSLCKVARVPVFVKQLGAWAYNSGGQIDPRDADIAASACRMSLRHSKGGDPSEWPEDLRVREFPA